MRNWTNQLDVTINEGLNIVMIIQVAQFRNQTLLKKCTLPGSFKRQLRKIIISNIGDEKTVKYNYEKWEYYDFCLF